MASGSDHNVLSPVPWIGIDALLTRRDQTSGKVYAPDETVNVPEALRAYTINSASLTYDEKVRGSLETRKLADLALVQLPDLCGLERNTELCFSVRDWVLATMVDGNVQYAKAGSGFGTAS